MGSLVKRSRYHHALFRKIGKSDIKSEFFPGLAVIAEGPEKMSGLPVVQKCHVCISDLGADVSRLACPRQIELSERQSSERSAIVLEGLVPEPEQRNTEAAAKTRIGNRKTEPVFPVSDIVVVPFLYAPFRSFDVISVIDPVQLFGIARMRDIAVLIQKPLFFGYFSVNTHFLSSANHWAFYLLVFSKISKIFSISAVS